MYICHYCIDYKTNSISDIIRHFKRKNKCKCCNIFTYEEAFNLSKNKKYEFTFDTKNLSRNDYIYIISHFLDKLNIINENFMIQNINKNKIIESSLIKKDEIENNDNLKDEIKYNCINCKKEFVNIYSLKRHYANSNACKKNQEANNFKEIQSKLSEILKKENMNQYNTFINNNIQNINNNNKNKKL